MSSPETRHTPQNNIDLKDLSIDEICQLANSFAEQGVYDRAIYLYETACRLFPDNVALKINLGRIKNLKKQTIESPSDFIQDQGEDEITKSELIVDQCQGLGEVFARSGRPEEAKQIYEISKLSQKGSFLPYYNLGKLYLDMREPDKAISELEIARDLSPFEVDILDLLGEAYFQHARYVHALETWVDALLISGEGLHNRKGPFRDRIKMVTAQLPNMTQEKRNQLIKERRAHLTAMFQGLQGEIEKMGINVDGIKLGDYQKTHASIQTDENTQANLNAQPAVAAEPNPASAEEYDPELFRKLKQHLIFRNMEDKDVQKILPFTSQMSIRERDPVYHEGDPIYGFYLIHRGQIEFQKETHFGPLTYTTFDKGSFFGDDNLLSGRERFTTAIAVQESDLIFIDKAGLAMVFAREKRLAIHFLWYFWKSLSFQIRDSNERMKNFFSISSESAMKKALTPGHGAPTHVEIDKKIEVLQSKGLNPRELSHIARLSNEEIYNKNETIFQEGDSGDRLYIVLEGGVVISKRIPNVGEEALAVLKKGDFFGEMSLAGTDHVRSADAKATEQNTVLLVITRQALKEILSIDVDSAYQFLTILCRILSQRLLEINEKIYQWRLMSGSFK